MDLDKENNDEPNWDLIQTITTFDGINQVNSSTSYNSSDVNGSIQSSINTSNQYASTRVLSNGLMELITAKASTPVSLLVESLVQQLCVLLEPDKKKSTQLYNTICENLHKMNLIDESYAMGEFEMMRTQYQSSLYQLVNVCRGQDFPSILQNVWPLAQVPNLDWSRYFREFDELAYIDGGGFGKVFKARNKLDGIEYAIKKITIKSTNVNNVLVHLSEVKTLASLNHTNIVSYKAAWLEPYLATTNTTDDKKANEYNETIDSESSYAASSSHFNDSLKLVNRNDDTSEFIHFETSINNQSANHAIGDCSDNASVLNNNVICKYSNNRSLNIEESKPHLKLKWATLFIQMTLCNKTLRQFLDERNKHSDFDEFYKNFLKENKSKIHKLRNSANDEIEGHPNAVVYDLKHIACNFLQQLLEGLDYIHCRNVVHHDIKPSNIFVTIEGENQVVLQLGDFGLACPLHNSHTGVGFGTPLYAAPEQLDGRCFAKSDIYSLGIILIELLLTFSTDMERATTINDIKKGILPPELNDPLGNIIKQMVNPSVQKRPNTKQLLATLQEYRAQETHENIKMVSALKYRLSIKDQQIELLKSQIKENNVQIEYIKKVELETKNEELKVKDQEIETLKSQITKMEYTANVLKDKEDEIDRLKQLIIDLAKKEDRE